MGSLDGKKPTPLSSDELKGILQKTGEIKTEKTLRPKQHSVLVNRSRLLKDHLRHLPELSKRSIWKRGAFGCLLEFLVDPLRLKLIFSKLRKCNRCPGTNRDTCWLFFENTPLCPLGRRWEPFVLMGVNTNAVHMCNRVRRKSYG